MFQPVSVSTCHLKCMVSSFGSNRVVASLPFSVMPLLRSEAETDEANFCQYVYVTKLFVKEQPADFFGLAEMEDVYERTRNAIFWCYCHLAPDIRSEFEWQIVIALDMLTTLRYTDPLSFPDSRIVAGLPDALEGTKLPLTNATKRDFYVATLFISYLDACPLNYCGFRWSTFRENLWESFNKAVQRSEVDNRLRIGHFSGATWVFQLTQAAAAEA